MSLIDPTTLLAEITHRCPLHCPYCSNPLETGARERGADDRGLEAGVHPGARAGRAAARPVRRRAARAAGRRGARGARALAGSVHDAGHVRCRADPASSREAARGRARAHPDLDPGHRPHRRRPHRRHERRPRRSWRPRPSCASSISRSRSTSSFIAPNIDRVDQIIDLAASLGADRLELANTQYYGWALENRNALMPTRGAGGRRLRGRRRGDPPARRAGCRSSTCCPTTTRRIRSRATADGAGTTWW